MATSRAGIPLRPSPTALRERAVTSLVRAAIATGLSALNRPRPPSDFARKWGDDEGMKLVLRAAVSPTSVAGTPPLAHITVSLLQALAPMSAGADLLNRAIALNFDGAAQINVPGIAIPTAGFVSEGSPIPAVMAPTSPGAILTPHKLGVIIGATHEMLMSANIESLLREVLIEATGPAIDKQIFSANAAGAGPAGLMNGITALTPAAPGEKISIIVDDLQQLATAIAPVSGNSRIAVIAAPAQAVALMLRLYGPFDWPILTSSSLAPGTVIMLALNAIVGAIEGAPVIDASVEAEFHRETSPAEIVTSAGTVAVPVGSLYQTDQVGLRLRWPISWGLRSSTGLAWMQNVNW
jgi:hypothetical protein